MFMLPTLKLNIERWKYNPTFELYVSNMGHIRNKSKADIAPKVTSNGYMAVFVHGSLNQYMRLHRVVMLTWRPTPEAEYLTIDHLDHNKRNNAVSNLEWVSEDENLKRAKADFINEQLVFEPTQIAATPHDHSHFLITADRKVHSKLPTSMIIKNTDEAVLDFITTCLNEGISSMNNFKMQTTKDKLLRKLNILRKNGVQIVNYMGLTFTNLALKGENN